MRKRIWIPLVIVLAAGLLLLVKARQHHRSVETQPTEALANRPSQAERPQIVEHHQATNVPNILVLPPSASPLAQAVAKTNPIAAQLLAAWQGEIEFYGKVVDENSNAITGAQVSFHWVEMPDATGNKTANTQSDAEGLFALHNQRGLDLGVSISKEGYYSSRRDNDSFRYGSIGGGKFSPDPQNPVIFHLRKKGQGVELVTSANGMRSDVWVRIPKDNTSVRVDFFQKQASPTGQLEISQNKPPFQGATNWSFSLSIPDGGLIENQDELQFEAPETGYQPSVEYDFTKGETNWTTQVTKQFYITFGQPRKYGWLRIESNLAQETIFLTYAINPSGSQNLEPSQ